MMNVFRTRGNRLSSISTHLQYYNVQDGNLSTPGLWQTYPKQRVLHLMIIIIIITIRHYCCCSYTITQAIGGPE